MNRPWKSWLVFGLCSAVLLAVMGWVSGTTLRLDRAQARAQRDADLESNVRLALWRMESMLAPLVAQETARPYFAYNAFFAAERAYGNMFNTLNPGDALIPSPLLTQVSPNVLLHFQFNPQGRLTSPEVPEGNQRRLAEAQFTTRERIEAAAARLREFERIMAQPASPELARLVQSAFGQRPPNGSDVDQPAVQSPSGPGSVRSVPLGQGAPGKPPFLDNGRALFLAAPAPQGESNLLGFNSGSVINPAVQQRLQSPQKKVGPQQDFAGQQIARNDEELQARQTFQQNLDVNTKNSTLVANYAFVNYGPGTRINVAESLVKPLWFGDALVLVRRVAVQGQEYVQGCWLDWPGICRWLLDGVKDLLPAARLEPLKNNGDDPQARLLASLPVRLLPGPAAPGLEGPASPILFALILAWICALVAGVAVALLLQGALSLSERRAAFVSAVTHELRTPLTTFKMYSEMLAAGMVPDEAKRRDYLSTLCAEANRLNHLVENVLAYARLERGSARTRIEKITLRELIERVKPRLVQRAGQAGMTLQEDADGRVLATTVRVDTSAVEQILFNLVDNACKYAAPSAVEKVIHLEALPENAKFTLLRVRDHGQGISAQAAKRLFRPFSKSAHEAASSAPGVGLGLALCRRLCRSLGGDLRFNSSVTGGACFEVLLPSGQC